MIRRRLLAAGVALRPPVRQRTTYPLLDNRDWLEQRYLAEEASTARIAQELGCQDEWVRQALLRHGIPVRSLSEAYKVRRDRKRARPR